MATPKSLDAAHVNFVDLSDANTTPEGNAVPPPGGSSSSSASGQQLSSPTLPGHQSSGSLFCKCPSAEQVPSEPSETTLPSPLPCEEGRNNCPCCMKRELDMDWTCDVIENYMGEIVDAIGEFRELYQAMEYVKAYCKSQEPKNEVLERVAQMNGESEERLQKFMAQQQVVVAQMNGENEERLEKFMAQHQDVVAQTSGEKEERLQQFMAQLQVVMTKMNEENEERLQKFMVEQPVAMAKIIANAVKDLVKDAVHESTT